MLFRSLRLGVQRILTAWAGTAGSSVLLIIGAALLLLITAGIASVAPARRALAVDPIAVLRSE